VTLTARDIEDRMEEAAYTLRRLPEKDRPRGYGASWPPTVQEAKHAYGYTPEAPKRGSQALPQSAVWRNASTGCPHRLAPGRHGKRWRQVCIRAGVVRSTA